MAVLSCLMRIQELLYCSIKRYHSYNFDYAAALLNKSSYSIIAGNHLYIAIDSKCNLRYNRKVNRFNILISPFLFQIICVLPRGLHSI